jgi:putative transcriptional regulator
MTTDTGITDLTGKLLIAMPGMGDPRFEHSLIFLCSHTDEGSMGLMINKPTQDVTMTMLMEQLNIQLGTDLRGKPVHIGGPVETGRGFVLHSTDFRSDMATLNIGDNFRMTATLDVLENIAAGTGPDKRLLMLGYSGWGPGQLEGEIARNGWLICDATIELVFDTPGPDYWEQALASLGIPAMALSAEGGHA